MCVEREFSGQETASACCNLLHQNESTLLVPNCGPKIGAHFALRSGPSPMTAPILFVRPSNNSVGELQTMW